MNKQDLENEMFDDNRRIPSALDKQVGGSHYKSMAVQPLENTYLTLGYEALRGACYCKTDKYLRRMKGDFAKHVEDIGKAVHILQVQLELATREMEKRNRETK